MSDNKPTIEDVDLPEEDEGPDMNEGTEFAEKNPLVEKAAGPGKSLRELGEEADAKAAAYLATGSNLRSDEPDDEINPHEVEVTSVDVTFLTAVQATTLGEAAEIADLNVIRNGLDSYYVQFADTETGRTWIRLGGRFMETRPMFEEGPDASADG